MTVDPETVSIAGTLENIDPVTSVSLEPIDLEGAQGDMIIEAKVKLPEGVIAATPSTVKPVSYTHLASEDRHGRAAQYIRLSPF